MRRTLFHAVSLAALVALGGCGSLRKGNELSYAQVQAIQPGLTAAQVRDSFGDPLGMERAPDGKIRGMNYATLDAQTNRARLNLQFDAREILVSKHFTGAPPKP